MTLRDEPEPHPVRERSILHRGWVWNLAAEQVAYGGSELRREFVDHTSAVAVLALNSRDEALLISQYRHPVRHRDWELPAGLLDSGCGEPPLAAARRELAEEAGTEAQQWWTLLDFWTSPGGSNESIRIYLARELRPATHEFAREHEEADIRTRWVPLDAIITAVLAGDLHNPALLQAAFAAAESRRSGWASLRPADAPWPTRSAFPDPTPLALVDGKRA